jgi:glycopeptide antibiotics resistance protein
VLLGGYLKGLSKGELRLFLATLYGYPLIESVVKLGIVLSGFTIDSPILNRAEHFLFNVAVIILIMPLLRKMLDVLSFWQGALVVLGAATLIGNAAELVQWILRTFIFTSENTQWYYGDTILDMLTNFIGAVVAIVVLRKLRLYWATPT